MIRWFTYHTNAANLLMVAIILLGVVALPDLQRETFPSIENDKVEVRVVYRGATASEVEDAICRRLEEATESVVGLEEVRCESSEGVGVATLVKLEGIEMPRFLDDVKTSIDSIDDFPSSTEQPITEELGRTDAVVSIAITGPDDAVTLKAYAEAVKARLKQQADVATITIQGFSDHQLRIEVSQQRLRQFGLSAADITNSIQQQSVSTPAGKLEGHEEDVLLRFDDQRKSVRALQDLVVISGQSGAAIKLGELATIRDRFEQAENKILFDGDRAAILNITKTANQDLLKVFDQVAAFVNEEQARSPTGIALTLTQDRSSVVRDRLDMLLNNGIAGLILVFLVLWLFFSFRYSFWVTMGLPVSFLGGLFVLPMVDVTINMISMVGLLIGIGLLMDDAIVIAENIASRLGRGDRPMQAALTGVKQVMPGILSSFTTTVLVFGSLAFISGEIGQVLRVMPIVLLVVLSVSLLEAFLVLPSHLGHSLGHIDQREDSRFRQAFERGFNRLRDNFFGPMIDFAVEYRYLTVGVVIMLLILAVAMPAGGKLKFVGFPAIEGDIIEARLLLPQGTPLARTETVVQQLIDALEETNQQFKSRQPDQQDLVQHVTIIYGENPDAHESGPHVARIVADLLSGEVRDAPLEEFRQVWREKTGLLTDLITITYTEPTLGPGGRALDIRLIGDDLNQLQSAAIDVKQWLGSYAGVTDLNDDLRPGKREYQFHLKESAGVLGLDAQNVANQLRSAFQGSTIDEFPVGTETYEVDLRLTANNREERADLDKLAIIGPNHALIPLTVVAEIEESRGWARIHRIDGLRAVTVQGDVQSEVANAQELLSLAAKELFPQLEQQYPDLKVSVRGQSNESAETGQSIVRNVLLGMVGIYMLLALQFRGYLAPVTVMSVIPTALIGVVFGHMLMGLDLTLPSMIGMASLFGVVVNDSILLVVFIREARKQGIATHMAAKQAGRARFRPILLTSITTVAGLMPLLSETSLQAQILIPLATSLAFGLTSATLIAIFLVPAIYCILDDFNALGEVESPDTEIQHL
ncbi:MAG: efflux RND transporter permease subunit [Gammaproteobacteria bacterium]|jgi:multidrug efflux pump subunit AcrB|nr:efflux RND transporter permease subunit [Gammaproteobacteria bacterium]MBT3488606.1 efflux RND transporter permease subunit [Gammaproteobacteria bacterium]MBT3717722.1 efflux RND transporter permease subunit [Gammaproteobacteria bacterium]MBT3844096.1 efflux RND transporter permease subunit [Gammaproteobacteria bacterium]MBT3893828.1 efflux RND transporter permease subunit [Gammaproteobacteria bacterium]